MYSPFHFQSRPVSDCLLLRKMLCRGESELARSVRRAGGEYQDECERQPEFGTGMHICSSKRESPRRAHAAFCRRAVLGECSRRSRFTPPIRRSWPRPVPLPRTTSLPQCTGGHRVVRRGDPCGRPPCGRPPCGRLPCSRPPCAAFHTKAWSGCAPPNSPADAPGRSPRR